MTDHNIDAGAVFPQVEPNPSIPKTIGTLNIIFGSLLLLCGACTVASTVMQIVMAPMMEAQQRQMQATIEAAHQAEIAAARKMEDEAKTPKEKAALMAQRKALEAQPVPKMPDMSKMGVTANPQFVAYTLVDAGTGCLLNIAMLVAGIGLISLKEWARRLALWTAGIKIARLFGMYGFFIIVLAPQYAKLWTDMFAEMGKQARGGIPPQQIAAITSTMTIMMASVAVAMIVLGSIYPAVSIYCLTRPDAKAACAEYSLRPEVADLE
jgi:hypothetical protein